MAPEAGCYRELARKADMPEVVIVSPYFPPSTLAGVHRARHLAKWLPATGWKPIVLCVHEAFHEQKLDAELAQLVPADLEVIKVGAVPGSVSRMLGIGDVGMRAWFQLRRAMLELARRSSVKAVLITGSPYYPMLLAPWLSRRFDLPVVLDFQDPWLSSHRAMQPLLSKAGVTHQLAKWLEPRVLRAAAHITSVSAEQNLDLVAHYPWLARVPMTDIPIGIDPDDFLALRRASLQPRLGRSTDGKIVLAYVGTIWPKVIPTLRVLLRALAQIRSRPDIYQRLRVVFVGTSSNPSDTGTLQVLGLAEEEGVGDIVEEVPQRLPYLEALSITANADVNIIIGSDEPHYSASKVCGILMAGRPHFSLLREESRGHAVCKSAGGGIALPFASIGQLEQMVPVIADAIVRLATARDTVGPVAAGVIAPFEAAAIAAKFAQIFDSVGGQSNRTVDAIVPMRLAADLEMRSAQLGGGQALQDRAPTGVAKQLKRVLCISPHFPPVNAADMHRLRHALPYFREFGWEPVVFAVAPNQVEMVQDRLLLETVPSDIEVHLVGAAATRCIGIGNLGMRSWMQYRQAVSRYLSSNHIDLIFFTTTVFTSIGHGPGWKRQCGAPLVIDLQDPWRNDYYLSLPWRQRPKKFWFDFVQRSLIEARTMPFADGLIAVSDQYIETMRSRYHVLRNVEAITLPFAASALDFEIARRLPSKRNDDGLIRIAYVGRGGGDMPRALVPLFTAVAELRQSEPHLAARLRLIFTGTSYAPGGRGRLTIKPIADRLGIGDLVVETPDRVAYFDALRMLIDADMLFIPGSEDEGYTASKIFPYILAKRPLLAVFHERSSSASILRTTKAGEVVTFAGATPIGETTAAVKIALVKMLSRLPFTPDTDWSAFEVHSARVMTRKCCELFDRVLACASRASQ